MKYSPSDCQRPEVLNKNLVQGNILLCGYSFNFVVGTASIKKVSETAKILGAIGFVLAVENVSPGTKFDPVPVGIPGILISDVGKSMVIVFSPLLQCCLFSQSLQLFVRGLIYNLKIVCNSLALVLLLGGCHLILGISVASRLQCLFLVPYNSSQLVIRKGITISLSYGKR